MNFLESEFLAFEEQGRGEHLVKNKMAREKNLFNSGAAIVICSVSILTYATHCHFLKLPYICALKKLT